MKNIKYIYWFAFYNEDSPSVRYRAKYPLAYLKNNYSIESALIVPGYHIKKMIAFIRIYFSALFFRKKDSLIVIQRVHSNFIYANLLKLLVLVHKRNTVYDLDDSDYLYLSPKPFHFFARNCSHITAGSRAIAEYLSRFNENIIVTTSPTPDLNVYKKTRSDIFTIGWIGSFGGDHKKSIVEQVFPAIKELNFGVRLVILGVLNREDERFIMEYFKGNKNVEIEIPNPIDWQDELEIQNRIVSFDIGIATLLDNEIQKSKSGIKAKQYLNNGVPVLGTKLPENDWVIKDGYNGFFCEGYDDYRRRLIEFQEMDSELFYRFSKNARRSNREFDLHKYCLDFMKINASPAIKMKEHKKAV